MALENTEHFAIFLYICRYDMDMFMLGIRMPNHYIRLLSITHILHVFF